MLSDEQLEILFGIKEVQKVNCGDQWIMIKAIEAVMDGDASRDIQSLADIEVAKEAEKRC